MPARSIVLDLDGVRGPADLANATAAVRQALARHGHVVRIIGVGRLAERAMLDLGATGLDLLIEPERIGLAPDDPAVLAVAAAAAGGWPRDLVVVASPGGWLEAAASATGSPVVRRDGSLDAGLDAFLVAEQEAAAALGVGPHPEPWPDDARLDRALLEAGDRRNVEDRFRYWREDAIVAELDRTRSPFHVAIENWQHDLNIGTIVRTANAFNAGGVHVIGRRRWNRRGAMATDRYLRVEHHAGPDALAAWADAAGMVVIGIDNVPGAEPLEDAELVANAVLVFGQEGPGLSDAMVRRCERVLAIGQGGSTRSLNAGVAAGIAMHAWFRGHVGSTLTWPRGSQVP